MKPKFFVLILLLIAMSSILTSCLTIRQGEVGVKRVYGKLREKTLGPGFYSYNPFTSVIIKIPTRTINLQVGLENLPSKEGLIITAEMGVLFHIDPKMAGALLTTVGEAYEQTLVSSVFRSSAADVCARFFAKDMYTVQREVIEREITAKMMTILGSRGIIIEHVLIKQIELPKGLSQSIEQKLEAEQQAQQMEFVLQKEKKEAERKVIEARGISDAQKILSEGLSKQIIELKSIEAFKLLANSPNAKIIITDGKTPFLINTSKEKE